MNEAVNLVANEALLVLGSMLIALLCALPGFVLDFFVDLGRKKQIMFFILALCVAVFMSLKELEKPLYFTLDIVLNLLIIYFGLLLLKAFKNMGSRFGMCKICEKLKSKLRAKREAK